MILDTMMLLWCHCNVHALCLFFQLPRGKQANPLVQALMGVQAILGNSLGQQDTNLNRNIIDAIDTNLKKMQDNVKKIKVRYVIVQLGWKLFETFIETLTHCGLD